MRVAKVNVYLFEELSEVAKKKAKDDFLETDIQNTEFQYTLDDFYESMFPSSNLKYQYRLSYHQGDGFNTYGSLNVKDLDIMRSRVASGDLYKGVYQPIYSNITDDEWKLLMSCFDEYGTNITIPFNRRYYYSLAQNIDLEDWSLQLRPLDKIKYSGAIEKFQYAVRDLFNNLNKYWERYGYDFLYNISDNQFEDFCNANGWEFHENGIIWSLD